MLQQMKNKISMGLDDKQRKKEEKEPEINGATKTAELEEREDYDTKKFSEPHSSSSKGESDEKSKDGPNRLRQNRITRWIDYILNSSIAF